jgi:hypothetical protein
MADTKVGESKEGGTDPLAAKRQPPRPAQSEETEQLVVTVRPSKGEVLMVERMEKSGQRREISAEEFAALAGEDEAEDIGAALEEAYAAGIVDALGGEDVEDEDEEDEEAENAVRELILGRAAGRLLLRRSVRRIILRRALRRRLLGRRAEMAKAGRRERKN